jgi:hypothetical protein
MDYVNTEELQSFTHIFLKLKDLNIIIFKLKNFSMISRKRWTEFRSIATSVSLVHCHSFPCFVTLVY